MIRQNWGWLQVQNEPKRKDISYPIDTKSLGIRGGWDLKPVDYGGQLPGPCVRACRLGPLVKRPQAQVTGRPTDHEAVFQTIQMLAWLWQRRSSSSSNQHNKVRFSWAVDLDTTEVV